MVDHEQDSGQPTRDSDYYGVFGPPTPAAPPADFAPPAYPPPQPTWSPPEAAPALPVAVKASRWRRRTVRPAVLIAGAALTALVVGGAAGYGGARLAQQATPAAAPAASASPDPDPQSNPPGTDPSPSAAPTSVAPLPPAPTEVNTVAVAKRTLPSTVMIQVGSSTGSGFVLDTDGHIMTNNHVVASAANGRKIRVVFAGGKRGTATLLGRSPSYDLAVIKVKASADLKPMAIGNSDQTEVGQPVIAIGSPLGLPGTVTQGIVSAVNRPLVVGQSNDVDNPTAYINGIQTDAPINPGNSGGPMVDAAARVIGVNSAILTMGASQGSTGNIGLGFAIPINQARVIGEQLISKGRATYPVIGATVETTDEGVAITTIDGSGPAAKAGLREGDQITKIDGRVVIAKEELIVAIRTRRPGQVITLDYTRGSASDQAKVTLGSRVG